MANNLSNLRQLIGGKRITPNKHDSDFKLGLAKADIGFSIWVSLYKPRTDAELKREKKQYEKLMKMVRGK